MNLPVSILLWACIMIDAVYLCSLPFADARLSYSQQTTSVKKTKRSRGKADKYNILDWHHGPVWALGDIHGDLHGTLQLMRSIGLIDDVSRWCGGRSLLVQTGDLLDRGHHGVAVIAFLEELRKEARAAGGDIIQLLGNHELMNLQGIYTYVSSTDLEHTGGHHNRKKLFSTGGKAYNIVKNYRTAVIVNDNLFVHAGIHPHFAKYSVKHINKSVTKAIHRETYSGNRLLTVEGPLWSREISNDDEELACALVKKTLDMYGVNRMIVGHTMQYYGISARCDGRLFIIDTGLSYAMLKRPTILKLTDQVVSGYEFYTTQLGFTVEVTVLHPTEEEIISSARASAAAADMKHLLKKIKVEKEAWDSLIIPKAENSKVNLKATLAALSGDYEIAGLDIAQLEEQLQQIENVMNLDKAEVEKLLASGELTIPLEQKDMPERAEFPKGEIVMQDLLASASKVPVQNSEHTTSGYSENEDAAALLMKRRLRDVMFLIQQQLHYIRQNAEMRKRQ